MSTTANNQRRLSARITGRVQGVGFRAFTQRTARQEGIHGWVRNESDGSVRLEAEGPEDALNALREAIEQGPRAARVEDVSAEWKSASGEFDRFSVRR